MAEQSRGRNNSGGRRFEGDRQGGGRDRYQKRDGERREGGYRRRDDDRSRGDRPYRDRREGSGNGDRDRREGDRRDRGRSGDRPRFDSDRREAGYRRREDDRSGDRRHGGYDRREGGYRRREDARGGDRRYQDREGRRDDRRRDDRRDDRSRSHSNRGGSGREERKVIHAQRPGYREERIKARANAPALPNDLDIRDLDPLVLQDLKVLAKDNAEVTAKHMLMAAIWMADDPQLALQHARAAKDRGGRVSVVRETLGIAAYHAGEWKEALSELRAARRMSGSPGLVAVMADCERGLGRPEKAIEFAREEDNGSLDLDTRIELGIVVSGARHDLGQIDAALVELERLQPSRTKKSPTWARLSYAYADMLSVAGRLDEAREWFQIADEQDQDGYLDAADRLKELG